MIWLRAILYYIFLGLSTLIFGLTTVLLSKLAPMRYVDSTSRGWSRTNIWLQRIICGLHVNIQGQAHLATQPCIFLVKHQSAWETISLHHYLSHPLSWIIKKELLSVPVLSQALKATRSIPIDREARRRAITQLVRSGSRHLQDGRSVILCPEGTRTAPGERQKYNIGGALLAKKAGFSVIPIAHNAGVYWARQGLKKYPGTIQVRIGSPIDPTGKSAADIMAETETWIEETLQTLPTQRPS